MFRIILMNHLEKPIFIFPIHCIYWVYDCSRYLGEFMLEDTNVLGG